MAYVQFPATITFDQTSYEVGETMLATVTYDNVNKQNGPCRCCRNDVTITSVPARDWVKVSDDGFQAQYKATA